jgi:hypothetical protein
MKITASLQVVAVPCVARIAVAASVVAIPPRSKVLLVRPNAVIAPDPQQPTRRLDWDAQWAESAPVVARLRRPAGERNALRLWPSKQDRPRDARWLTTHPILVPWHEMALWRRRHVARAYIIVGKWHCIDGQSDSPTIVFQNGML